MKGKKGVKTHLKERTEIFLRLSIHDNGVRMIWNACKSLRRTNVREKFFMTITHEKKINNSC